MRDDFKTDAIGISEGELSINQQRKLDFQRLEKLLAYWYPIAASENLTQQGENPDREEASFEKAAKAVPVVLRIMERKATLLGLNRTDEEPSLPSKEKSLEELASLVKAKNPYLFFSQYDHSNSGRISDI